MPVFGVELMTVPFGFLGFQHTLYFFNKNF